MNYAKHETGGNQGQDRSVAECDPFCQETVQHPRNIHESRKGQQNQLLLNLDDSLITKHELNNMNRISFHFQFTCIFRH